MLWHTHRTPGFVTLHGLSIQAYPVLSGPVAIRKMLSNTIATQNLQAYPVLPGPVYNHRYNCIRGIHCYTQAVFLHNR
jgi:hypothetical protein